MHHKVILSEVPKPQLILIMFDETEEVKYIP